MQQIKNILGHPSAGWTDISINGLELGSASYLDDVPMMCLNACNKYLSDPGVLPFGLSFDAEGYEFGIIEIDESLYAFSTDTKDGIPKLQAIPGITGLATDTVLAIGAAICTDIENDLDAWASFCDCEGIANETEKKSLRKKINKLRRLGCLEEERFICTDEIIVSDDHSTVNVTYECYIDVCDVWKISNEEDSWVNFYTQWNGLTDCIDAFAVVHTDDSSTEYHIRLSKYATMYFKDKMRNYVREKCGCELNQLLTEK